MSWLARSIANSLLIDDDIDGETQHSHHPPSSTTTTTTSQSVNEQQQFNSYNNNTPDHMEEEEEESENQGRGVKEDLSEFTESITRQLWGVASFLAPPPPPPPPPPLPSTRLPPPSTTTRTDPFLSDRDPGDSSVSIDFSDGRDDVSQANSPEVVGDRLRDGNGISDQIEEAEEDAAVGVTEEALAFAMNIAHHPETWLDFPLSEEEDNDDFEMSDTQWNHVTLVEHLVPRLAALRIELCPVHMSESYFWKVYFVLLHPRLNKHDADLLSTPQIVAARAMWMKELQKRTKPETEVFERNTSYIFESSNVLHEEFDATSSDAPSGSMSEGTAPAFEPYYTTRNFETQKYPVVKNENHVLDKSVAGEEGLMKASSNQIGSSSYKIPIHDFEDGEDDWINENSELDGYDGPDVILGSDEDISFSDLEADDDCTMPIRSRNV